MSTKGETEELQITVTGRNMPVSDPLETYVRNKLSRLSRYLDRLARVNVILSGEHTRETSGRNVAEGSTTVMGRVIRAEAVNANMYAAIDGLVDKLHLQLTKTKERARDHKHRTGVDGIASNDDLADGTVDLATDVDASAENSRIVEVKQYSMKPMFPDEAVEELEELGRAFFVFLNARNEKVSVVYRRHDGSYALIEPAFA